MIVQLSHGSLDPHRWIHGDVPRGRRRCSRPGHELRSAGVMELAPSGPRDAGHEKWWWKPWGCATFFHRSGGFMYHMCIYIYTIYYNYNK